MISRKAKFIIVVVLALTAIPYTRNVIQFQLGRSVNQWYTPRRSTPMDSVPKSLDDALILGSLAGTGSERADRYWRMTRSFPNAPALYANMLIASTQDRVFYGSYCSGGDALNVQAISLSSRPTQPGWRPIARDERVSRIVQAIDAGKRIEPANSFYDLVEAALLIQEGRDSDALRVIHRAAGKSTYDDHVAAFAEASLSRREREVPSPIYWMDSWSRGAMWTGITMPHLASIRNSACVTAWYAGHSAWQGDHRRAFELMSDLIRIGGLMRDHGSTHAHALVGQTVQDMGIRGVELGLSATGRDTTPPPFKRPQPFSPRLDRLRTAMPTGAPSEWTELRANTATSDAWRAARFRVSAVIDRGWTSMLPPALAFFLSSYLMQQLALLALVWISATALMRHLGMTAAPTAGPGRMSVWVLGVLPTFVLLFLMLGSSMGISWGGFYPPIRLLRPLVASLALPVVVLLIAAAGMRIAPELGRLRAFLSRLQRGSTLALYAVLGLYMLTMTIFITTNFRANRLLDTVIAHEQDYIRAEAIRHQ